MSIFMILQVINLLNAALVTRIHTVLDTIALPYVLFMLVHNSIAKPLMIQTKLVEPESSLTQSAYVLIASAPLFPL